MNFDQLINSKQDVIRLIQTYQQAVHGTPEVSEAILQQHPALRHPVTMTRDAVANNPALGQEMERLAVEGLAEGGMSVAVEKAGPRVAGRDAGLLSGTDMVARVPVDAESKPLDFARVVHSVEDIRQLVAAYRLALHGGDRIAQQIYQQYPELQPVVERTLLQAGADSASKLSQWEEVAVEALVERGLRTLEQQGIRPFDGMAPEPVLGR